MLKAELADRRCRHLELIAAQCCRDLLVAGVLGAEQEHPFLVWFKDRRVPGR